MNIDIASIDMVSEVNMVGASSWLLSCLVLPAVAGTAGIPPKWAILITGQCV